MTRLHALNPAAPILDAAKNEATLAGAARLRPLRPRSQNPRRQSLAGGGGLCAAAGHDHGHHHHDVNRHDARIRAFSLVSDSAIPASVFEMFLDLLRSLHGPNLLRLKGVVKLAEDPQSPLVIHGVQHVLHPPVRLPHWPDQDTRTRLVLITRDLDPQTVQALFDAFLGAAKTDQPDRAALVDNPLVPFGGLDR